MSVVLGTGMTRIGRHPERSLDDLARDAADRALADAGRSASEVDTVILANAFAGVLQGQESVRGEVIFARHGFSGAAIFNVENACASGASGVALGHRLVQASAAECVLVVGAEKLFDADRVRSLRALATATDVREFDEEQVMGGVFMRHYAEKGRRYLRHSGGQLAHFALAAARSSRQAAQNPLAHFQVACTPDEVLAAREVVAPLTLLMCCPISDGAAAVVLGREGRGPRIRAASVVAGGGGVDPTVGAGRRAFAEAGVGADDIDVVEVHDAAISGELLALEALGLCEEGAAGQWIADGHTDVRGRQPVNPSGGLVRRGHPIGATGIAQLVELSDQLRGRADGRQVLGARVAAAHNAGGLLGDEPAVAVVTVLEAP